MPTSPLIRPPHHHAPEEDRRVVTPVLHHKSDASSRREVRPRVDHQTAVQPDASEAGNDRHRHREPVAPPGRAGGTQAVLVAVPFYVSGERVPHLEALVAVVQPDTGNRTTARRGGRVTNVVGTIFRKIEEGAILRKIKKHDIHRKILNWL